MEVCMGGVKNKNNELGTRDENRKLVLLIALEKIEKPAQQDLVDATGIPERSIHLLTQSLNKAGVVIERINGRRYGYYRISDSGIFNIERLPEVVKKSHPLLVEKIELYAQRKKTALDEAQLEKKKQRNAAEGEKRMARFMRMPEAISDKNKGSCDY